ncbi:ABC transporter substrate-binding protein [Nocardioides sp. GY 10127]|uniref:ABC transporter substrate-binding protein n=1 Tax=Nocardioides sp. GY 10127 TaxID=2569762 RepID=UPI0010A7C23C|nr:ABC transporter substrate-binding protein [Nocardioides sp. GY 10127]TIC82683.1 nitrate ABC transporter substrate-binding protein [Nocardioides sp. GY 10127]
MHPIHAGLRRRSLLAAAALVLPLGLAACGGSDDGSDSADGTTTVSVGIIPIIDVAPIYLGIDQGFFSDEGLDLDLQTADGGAAIVPGVVSGQYQFGFSNTVSLLLAGSQGLSLKAVTAGVQSTGEEGADFGAVVVPAGSDISSPADLAGKKIAVNTLNNINTVTINAAVRAAGGDPSTIEYVELGFPDIAPAVASGDVDAGQLVEPFLTIATGGGDTQVVSNYAAADPDLEVGMYFTSADYADSDPDTVAAFTSAMNKSLDYAADHPDEVRDILSTYTDLDADVQANVVLPRWSSDVPTDAVSSLADLMVTDGIVDSTPDVSALLP